jgi:hypothetical protein
VRQLADIAAAASPGQRYLLERKLDERAQQEMQLVSRHIATEVSEALASHAQETVNSPVTRAATTAPGAMVLNAAFLVTADKLLQFQETLTGLVDRYTPRGFRFDFTGPWPAYHFASGAGDEHD